MRAWTYIVGTFVVITILAVIGKVATIAHNPTSQLPNQLSKSGPQTSSNTSGISNGKTPAIPLQLPSGFTVHIFAEGLSSPRDLIFTPNGTLLVSDISNNRVLAMPDINHDGIADRVTTVLTSNDYLHGLAFYKNKLYVAEVSRVVRYNWDESSLTASFDKTLFNIPGNNNHVNRTLAFDDNGMLYVSVGSTCNVCVEKSELSGTVIVSDAEGNNPHVFAKGQRNASFLAFNPLTHELWSTGMGRDYLGDNTPPDEINILRMGLDYGWPYCYGDKVHDNNFDPLKKHDCANTESPIFQIPAHSAPLGLTFIKSNQFPSDWQNDLLVAYHGSWNRSIATGYKVVHMKVNGNTISEASDFLTGFQPGKQKDDSLGRPVDVIFDASGNLYISDDKAGNVYIIQKLQ